MSPTDALGDWAIETRWRLGSSELVHAVADDGGAISEQELQTTRGALRARIWPVYGFHIGAEAAVATLKDGESSEWAQEEGLARVAVDEMVLTSGYLWRVVPSAMTGMSIALSLPIGTSWADDERVDLLWRGLIGMSYTPRWDFYLRPRLGYRTDNSIAASGFRGGWSVGFAYQRTAFSLAAYAGSQWNSEKNRSTSLSTHGGASIGYEVTPGLHVSLDLDGNNDRHGILGAQESEFLMGLAVRWVFYPGSRRNAHRQPDPRRGSDYKTWNPDHRHPLPEL